MTYDNINILTVPIVCQYLGKPNVHQQPVAIRQAEHLPAPGGSKECGLFTCTVSLPIKLYYLRPLSLMYHTPRFSGSKLHTGALLAILCMFIAL